MRSSPSRRSDASQADRRWAGRPLGFHPVSSPLADRPLGPVRSKPPLGRDEKAVVGREGFGDQLFRHTWAVGVGCVDELDAKLDRLAQ
jgi:hypothetical protein